MNEESPSNSTTLGTFFWPAFVVALLLGHMTLMLVVMSFANANPPEFVEGSPYSKASPKTEIESPSP